MTTRLYVVLHEEDGDNFDLLVMARTPAEAAEAWGTYFDKRHQLVTVRGPVPTTGQGIIHWETLPHHTERST